MDISKDISIGEDEWITWIEFDVESANPKDIDTFLEPTKEFWKHLEIDCVAECCGIDAFSFWNDDIQNAVDKAGTPNLNVLFKEIISQVELLTDEVIMSTQLNQLMNRDMFLKLLKHLTKNIKST